MKHSRVAQASSFSTNRVEEIASGPISTAIVLTVGMDLDLLSTRNLLLQNAGYVVVSAQSVKEAFNNFHIRKIDLVVVCHSIPQKDRDGLTCMIRASGALTPVISIAKFSGQRDVFATATLAHEPQELLAGIRDVLTKSIALQREIERRHEQKHDKEHGLGFS